MMRSIDRFVRAGSPFGPPVSRHFHGELWMSKVWNYRFASRAGLLIVAFASVVGCQSKGPAERAGASIDKGVQNAKDAINPPGPQRKQGEPWTGPSNPSLCAQEKKLSSSMAVSCCLPLR